VRAGFTLIEVVLVTAVLAILLVAAAPQFQRTADRLRVEQAASELAQLLRVAHARAVAEGRELLWAWDERARRARVRVSEGEELLAGSPIPEEISVRLTGSGGVSECACVHFLPSGVSEAATVSVASARHELALTIDEATSQVEILPGAPPR
jgi:type II secretion system protein H